MRSTKAQLQESSGLHMPLQVKIKQKCRKRQILISLLSRNILHISTQEKNKKRRKHHLLYHFQCGKKLFLFPVNENFPSFFYYVKLLQRFYGSEQGKNHRNKRFHIPPQERQRRQTRKGEKGNFISFLSMKPLQKRQYSPPGALVFNPRSHVDKKCRQRKH